MTLKECYAILQVNQKASVDDIKRAYRKRAFELHPDLHPDSPTANKNFQVLNEAYVVITKLLEAKDRFTKTKASKTEGKNYTQSAAGKQQSTNTDNKTEQKTKTNEEANAHNEATKKNQSAQSAHTGTTDTEKAAREQKQTHDTVHAAQHEVIKDILADPFARRVFEDIYSEIRKKTDDPSTNAKDTKSSQQNYTNPSHARPSSKTTQAQTPWTWPSFTQKNTQPETKNTPNNTQSERKSNPESIPNKLKNWMMHQIDDEQTFVIPAKRLFPGARIRLQIRQGFSDSLTTIDVTLPNDFSPNSPIRLKGLGKKLGKWHGDLYLTLKAKSETI